ncbi:MAG: GW dipeptide domain-containing protein [Bacteroidales bacterium]
MKYLRKTKAIFLVILTVTLFSCSGGKKENPAAEGLQKVTVKEVIQTERYTYLNADKDGKDQWLAVTHMDVKEGDVLYFATGFEMKNFESKDLKRTFESILFIDRISADPSVFSSPGESGAEAGSVPATAPKESTTGAVPEGTMSISDVIAKKNELKGKQVIVKGKITKANSGILGTNWYHITDGTKDGKPTDLTVTSDAFLNLGDEVSLRGTIVLDKDLGSGYFFEVLLEKAEVK